MDLVNVFANLVVACGGYFTVRGLYHWLCEKRAEAYARHTINESKWRTLQQGEKIQLRHVDGSIQQAFIRSIGRPDRAGRRILCVQDAFGTKRVESHLLRRDGTVAKRNVFNE